MNASLLEDRKFFGLFELNDEGMVLYSRIEPDGRTDISERALTGKNFFEEIVSFENMEEFRTRINRFNQSERQADNFIFTCLIDGDSLPVRVLLARIREQSNGQKTKSILVHIRKS
jgi:hypothetical protein